MQEIKMKYPICPNCNGNFSFFQGLKFLNPWNIKCPHCEIYIQGSRLYKALSVIAPSLGVAISAVAIYFEEIEKWETKDSLLYFVVVFSILFFVGYKAWPYMKFKLKSNKE